MKHHQKPKALKIEDPQNFRHWTWYLFLFANIAITVGIAIAWILWKNIDSPSDLNNPIVYGIPIIVFNVVSIISLIIFYYFDYKEINCIRMHIRPKWFKWYFVSIVIYFIEIIFVIIFYALKPEINLNLTTFFGILFGISVFLGFLNAGFYKFIRFKIDYDLYLRRQGGSKKNKSKKSNELKEGTSDLKSHASK